MVQIYYQATASLQQNYLVNKDAAKRNRIGESEEIEGSERERERAEPMGFQ